MYNLPMVEKGTDIPKSDTPQDKASGETKDELRTSLNERISQLCQLVALVIAGVAFTSLIIGQDDPTFVLMGLCLSVILLAIAGMNNRANPKR